MQSGLIRENLQTQTKMTPSGKTRDANIELLRVISMLMVTVLHALGHGGVLKQYAFGTAGYFLFWFLETVCYVAVNLFVLITAYFMVLSRTKISRLLKLIIQVETYSLFCLLISKIVFHQKIGPEEIIHSVFPITSGTYWFVSAYMILLLLVPFLNRLIRTFDRKKHLIFVLLLILLYVVTPSIFIWSRNILTEGMDFVWFIVLYFTGAYIRLYGNQTKILQRSSRRWLAGYGVFIGGGMLIRILIGCLTFYVLGEVKWEGVFYNYNSIIIFPASVCLFLAFQQMRIKKGIVSKTVLFFGHICFGVYLLTDHDLIREALWNAVNLPGLVSHGVILTCIGIIGIVILLFLSGCLFEWIRIKIMSLFPADQWLKAADEKFEKWKQTLH